MSNMPEKNIKLCAVTTRYLTVKWFMLDNLLYAAEHGFDITVICEPNDELRMLCGEKIEYIPMKMKVGFDNPVSMLKNTIKLKKIIKKRNFDIIQYASSNAGLYAAVAGFFARIPVRVYCQWGLLYVSYGGVKRAALKFIEKLTCQCSTVIQPDSKSNMDYAVEEKFFRREKGGVLWHGSASGVNLERFSKNRRDLWRQEILSKLNISDSKHVFGYVGRIVRDKGINELLEAFFSSEIQKEGTYLLLVGPPDGLDEIAPKLSEKLNNTKNVLLLGMQNEIYKYMAAFDFIVLPSYREGFGSVILEAAALGIPAIASDINGPKDFIVDGHNGFLCECRSSESLGRVMKKCADLTEEQYRTVSENAYGTVKNNYDSEIYKEKFLNNRVLLYDKQSGGRK